MEKTTNEGWRARTRGEPKEQSKVVVVRDVRDARVCKHKAYE